MPGLVSTDDYVALADLMARYCHTIDEGEAEAWVALFTPDGVMDGPGAVGVVGPEALMAFARGAWTVSNGGRMRHQVANLTLSYGASRDEAVGRFYNLVTMWGSGGRPMLMALSTVNYVRTGDGWRIQRNTYRTLGMDPPEDGGGR